jgi:hypothetical protein
MRQILRLIGTRYGVALVLIFIIAVVVGFGKLLGAGTHTAPGSYEPGPGSNGTAGVGTSPMPDDGLEGPPGSPVAVATSPGAAQPQTVALQFTRAWLHHTGVSATDWHAGVARYATKALADKLDGTDPAGVPASQITGDGTIVNQEPSYTDISIPLDSGTISLRLIVTDGRWMVDGVDWQRS